MKKYVIMFCASFSLLLLGCSVQKDNPSNALEWINPSKMAKAEHAQENVELVATDDYSKEIKKTKVVIDGSNYRQSGENLLASVPAILNTMGLEAEEDVSKKTLTYDINTFFFDANGLLCVNIKTVFNYKTYQCDVVKSYYLYDQTLYKEAEVYDMKGQIIVEKKKTYLPVLFLGKLYQIDMDWKQKEKILFLSGGGIANGDYTTKVYEPVTLSMTSGYYWSTNGKMTDAGKGLGEEFKNQFVCTNKQDFIPVQEGEEFRINYYFSWFDEVGGIVFFDDKDKLISYMSFNSSTHVKNQIVKVPKNAVKMHFTMYINQKYKIEKVGTIRGAKLSSISEEYYKKQSLAILEAYQKEELAKGKLDFKTDKAYLTFVLDDCRPDMDKIADIFEHHNIPLCISAIYENILFTTSQGKETRKEVCDRVVKNGGEILSHDVEVLTADLLKDYETMFKHFYNNKWVLESYGYDVNGIILAGGNGQVDGTNLSDLWARKYYLYSDLYGMKDYQEPYYHRRYWLGNSQDNYKKVIAEAIEKKEWIVFYVHDLKEVNAEKLNEILGYINTLDESMVEVTTYKNIYDNLIKEN